MFLLLARARHVADSGPNNRGTMEGARNAALVQALRVVEYSSTTIAMGESESMLEVSMHASPARARTMTQSTY